MTRLIRVMMVVVCTAPVLGCGGSQPATVKETLSEQEKQQVQDLNKQRQSEWSNTPKQK
jgi:hypothetical protein